MPKYLVEMHDGRKFQVEADSPPTEDDVMAHLGGNTAPKPSEPPQGVLGHPLNVQEGEPSTTQRMVNGAVNNQLIQGAAHPQSLGDVASLLLPEVPSMVVRGAVGVARAAKPYVAPVARAAANVVEMMPKLKNVIPFANPAKSIIPVEQAAGRLRTIAQTAQDADMGVTRGADMYNMERFPHSTESTARVPMTHGEPGVLTADQKIAAAVEQAVAEGKLRRAPATPVARTPSLRERFPNGLPLEMPDFGAIRTTSAPVEAMASHAPTGGKSAAFAEIPNDPAMEEIVNRMAGGAEAPSVGNGVMPAPEMTAPPAMLDQEARFNRGSQRHAREQGITRAESQAQTDAVQGTRSETSLVAPWEQQQRMMSKMEALRKADPTGRTLVEYIDKAADPKTKAALINWERQSAFSAGRAPFYTLAGATVAPSVRDMLLQRMRAGVTGGSGSEQ